MRSVRMMGLAQTDAVDRVDAGSLIAPRPVVKTRHALIALALAVACLAFGTVLQSNRGGTSRVIAAGALAHSYRQEGLLSVPAGAQGAVSAALGRDSHAYWVTAAGDAYRAVSPGQQLAMRFTHSGVSVTSSHALLGLALREIGHGTRL